MTDVVPPFLPAVALWPDTIPDMDGDTFTPQAIRGLGAVPLTMDFDPSRTIGTAALEPTRVVAHLDPNHPLARAIVEELLHPSPRSCSIDVRARALEDP